MEFSLILAGGNNTVGAGNNALYTAIGFKVSHGTESLIFDQICTQSLLKSLRFQVPDMVFDPLNSLMAQLSDTDQGRLFNVYKEYHPYTIGTVAASPNKSYTELIMSISIIYRIVKPNMLFAWVEWYKDFFLPTEVPGRIFFQPKEHKDLDALVVYYQLMLPLVYGANTMLSNIGEKSVQEWKKLVFGAWLKYSLLDERAPIYQRLLDFIAPDMPTTLPSSVVHGGVDQPQFTEHVLGEVFFKIALNEMTQPKWVNSKNGQKDNFVTIRIKNRATEAIKAIPKRFGMEVDKFENPKEYQVDEDNTSRNEQLEAKDKYPPSERVIADSAVCNYGTNSRDKVQLLATHVCGANYDKALLQQFMDFSVTRDWRFSEGQSFLLRCALHDYLEFEDLDLIKVKGEANIVGVVSYYLHTLGYIDLVKWLFSEVDSSANVNAVVVDTKWIKDYKVTNGTIERLRPFYPQSDILEQMVQWANTMTTEHLTNKVRVEMSPLEVDEVYRHGIRLTIADDFKEQLLGFLATVMERTDAQRNTDPIM